MRLLLLGKRILLFLWDQSWSFYPTMKEREKNKKINFIRSIKTYAKLTKANSSLIENNVDLLTIPVCFFNSNHLLRLH